MALLPLPAEWAHARRRRRRRRRPRRPPQPGPPPGGWALSRALAPPPYGSPGRPGVRSGRCGWSVVKTCEEEKPAGESGKSAGTGGGRRRRPPPPIAPASRRPRPAGTALAATDRPRPAHRSAERCSRPEHSVRGWGHLELELAEAQPGMSEAEGSAGGAAGGADAVALAAPLADAPPAMSSAVVAESITRCHCPSFMCAAAWRAAVWQRQRQR